MLPEKLDTPKRLATVYQEVGVGRTNIVLDDRLIAEAMRLLGAKSKREAVDLALRQVVARRSAQRALLRLRGKLKWEGDIDAWRRARR